uniref:Sugar transferase n=1 Tax=Eiseniibacteriota bacterium TaxID=2212470 RepID=A0A832I2T4_UNCEI
MEPDILASPSEAPVGDGWTAAGAPATPGRPVNGQGTATGRRVVSLHEAGHGAGGGRAHLFAHGGPSSDGRRHPGASLRPGWAVADAEVLPPLARASDEGFYLRYGKRMLDVVGATIALIVTFPLLVAAAIAIRLESEGPIFYRSVRIGRGGRPFTFLKLRSMVQDADRHRHQLAHLNEADGPVFKISRDPRVTRVGRFLRTTSIDEIPQFVNVLRGEMSLVGPRPPIPEEVAQYEPWQLHRLDVQPGITCLWQISGRSRIGFQEWMRLDLEYIRHRSFWLDLKILLRTLPAVLSREGAY